MSFRRCPTFLRGPSKSPLGAICAPKRVTSSNILSNAAILVSGPENRSSPSYEPPHLSQRWFQKSEFIQTIPMPRLIKIVKVLRLFIGSKIKCFFFSIVSDNVRTTLWFKFSLNLCVILMWYSLSLNDLLSRVL